MSFLRRNATCSCQLLVLKLGGTESCLLPQSSIRAGSVKMNISKLRNKAEGLVTQLTAKDDCERRVLEAISNKSYAAHITVLNEIAEDTFSHDRSGAKPS